MARTTARSALSEATPADDPGMRALLRESPLEGAIRISLEREPDASLAAGIEGDRHRAFVVREEATGRVIGMGSRSVRDVWLNGEEARLGYLGSLRRGRELTVPVRRLLAEGFELCEASRRNDELPYDLTSVVADNRRARRLLERGLPGLPTYRPCFEFMTLVIPATRASRGRDPSVHDASEEDLPAIADCLRRNLGRYQFAPRWTERDLRSPVRCRGLRPGDFLIARQGSRVIGCLTEWDQRAFKQAVVRGYGAALGRWRPVINAVQALRGRPRLPAPGSALDLAFLSHLAIDGDDPEVLVELIRSARGRAAERGVDQFVLGLAADNPMRTRVERAFPLRAYPSIIYSVHYSGGEGGNGEPARSRPDGRVAHLEVATL